MILKSKGEWFRAIATGLSIGCVGFAAFIYNEPMKSTGIAALYTLIILLLYLFLIAMISDEASDRKRTFNALFLLLVAAASLLFVIARKFG